MAQAFQIYRDGVSRVNLSFHTKLGKGVCGLVSMFGGWF